MAWLEDEGVSPVSVTVVDNETMELYKLSPSTEILKEHLIWIVNNLVRTQV